MVRSVLPTTIDLNYSNPDKKLQARIHPIKLQQILMNLAINARDAIDEYGHIDIIVSRKETRAICTTCYAQIEGEYIEIAVTDSGSGIDEQHLAKIFEPFFTTKEVGKGTGMGLSVVHGLVHSLGGHILISSTIGVGTTVRVLLAAATPEQNAQTQELRATLNTTPGSLKGCRVMVVDDEVMITRLNEDLLTMEDAKVRAYNNASEALAAFSAAPHSVDIVITDMTMPELSGFDMAMSMLKLRPDLPILLCTGYSDRVTEEIAIKNGIRGFMVKPITSSKLLKWVEAQYANRS